MTQEPSGHQRLGEEGGPSSEHFRGSVPVLHKPLWGESFCSFVVPPAAGPGGSPTQGPQNPVGGWAGHSVGGGALTSCRGGAWAPQGRGLEPCGRGLVPMGWSWALQGRDLWEEACGTRGGAWHLWGWSLGSAGEGPVGVELGVCWGRAWALQGGVWALWGLVWLPFGGGTWNLWGQSLGSLGADLWGSAEVWGLSFPWGRDLDSTRGFGGWRGLGLCGRSAWVLRGGGPFMAGCSPWGWAWVPRGGRPVGLCIGVKLGFSTRLAAPPASGPRASAVVAGRGSSRLVGAAPTSTWEPSGGDQDLRSFWLTGSVNGNVPSPLAGSV